MKERQEPCPLCGTQAAARARRGSYGQWVRYDCDNPQCGPVEISTKARRSLRDPSAYEVLIEVTNPSDEPLACRLFLERDDNPVDVLPVRVVAEKAWHTLFARCLLRDPAPAAQPPLTVVCASGLKADPAAVVDVRDDDNNESTLTAALKMQRAHVTTILIWADTNPWHHVITKNIRRRHLTPGQRIALVKKALAKEIQAAKAADRERQRSGKKL